jgi:serine/threonine-protein kinase HipA
MEMPIRLHQEDFCQALGLPLFLKYEPTDGHYASLIAHTLDEVSADPIADKIEFFRRLIFDYYIGNCDNHLKNRSILWTPDLQSCRLAPLYDLTSITASVCHFLKLQFWMASEDFLNHFRGFGVVIQESV